MDFISLKREIKIVDTRLEVLVYIHLLNVTINIQPIALLTFSHTSFEQPKS